MTDHFSPQLAIPSARNILISATSVNPAGRPIDRRDGRRIWLKVDVKDDPRDVRGKIFRLYDVTDVMITALSGYSLSGQPRLDVGRGFVATTKSRA